MKLCVISSILIRAETNSQLINQLTDRKLIANYFDNWFIIEVIFQARMQKKKKHC